MPVTDEAIDKMNSMIVGGELASGELPVLTEPALRIGAVTTPATGPVRDVRGQP
ncbi:hypothetical protein [Micromonospora robiginosa]|uniref:Uncharacterized protein n=1 Tax=Micromonospora robiginosa TaxID=2749844 RepID=A0A7L6B3L7_9ACTN|nr:hypothetical protein [Micromonospora ferruginea]QLQ36537.1 hypothetical protein H1D33_25140 [Micromonospora ferruginea]